MEAVGNENEYFMNEYENEARFGNQASEETSLVDISMTWPHRLSQHENEPFGLKSKHESYCWTHSGSHENGSSSHDRHDNDLLKLEKEFEHQKEISRSFKRKDDNEENPLRSCTMNCKDDLPINTDIPSVPLYVESKSHPVGFDSESQLELFNQPNHSTGEMQIAISVLADNAHKITRE